MSEKKPIIGIDLGIDPDYLEGVVKQVVASAITETISGQGEIANQLVREVLERKVSASGKVSSYSYENKYTLIEVLMSKAIDEVANELIVQRIKEMKPMLELVLTEELKKKSFRDKYCKMLLEAQLGHLSAYTLKVDFDFSDAERY